MNLSSKRSQVIILTVLFFVFAGAGGYLLWRVNQPETVAPEESEASPTNWSPGCTIISSCYPVGGVCVGDCAGGKFDYCDTCGIPDPDPTNCGDRVASDVGKAVGQRCIGKDPYTYECGAWCYRKGNGPNCCVDTPVSYKVTYSGNGGTCTPSSRTVNSGGNSAAPSCTRTGHSLKGYTRTSGSGGTLNTTTGAVTNVTGNQTIRANWDPNSYTVTYSAGTGGSCTPSTRSVNHGANSAAPTCTREGYTLSEFSRTSGDGGTLDAKTGAVTGVTGNQTITASWDAIPDPGCGDRAGTYPHTTTTWPSESPEWCEIGDPSEFDPNQQFPAPGQSISWKCVSGTTTANCSAKTEQTPEEPVVPSEAPVVPATGIFDDTRTAVMSGLLLLFLGFTWRFLGRGMYVSVEFLGRIPKKLSIHMKDVKEDIRMKKRISQLRKTDKRRRNFEKKVVKH